MAAQPILHPSVTTLECPPELIRGQEDRLLTLLLPLLERNDLVLDVSRVQSIDAAGIGLLVFLHQCADRAGTSLTLVHPSERLLQMLSLVHLDQVLLQQ